MLFFDRKSAKGELSLRLAQTLLLFLAHKLAKPLTWELGDWGIGG